MDIKKTFGTDLKKEIEGIWEDFGEGLKVKIARIGNPEYKKIFNKISRPYRKAIRRESLGEKKSEELLIKALVEAVVMDWKGLEEDGKPVPFTKENVTRILTEYKDFREQITEIASEMESFKLSEDEDTETNLKKS